MPEIVNICAGPYGWVYDYGIERPRVAQVVGRIVWGIDLAPLYASMDAVAELPDGATVLDVPCGGGVALRALRPGQRVRWIAVDLDPKMLERCGRRVAERGIDPASVELLEADMQALPLPDACADLCLSYSGLHMVPDPVAAIGQMARCVKLGGALVGSTLLRQGTWRHRTLLGSGMRTGLTGRLLSAEELRAALVDAGLDDVQIGPEQGMTVFRARRAA
jgi:SAM-dependent methyltransferase